MNKAHCMLVQLTLDSPFNFFFTQIMSTEPTYQEKIEDKAVTISSPVEEEEEEEAEDVRPQIEEGMKRCFYSIYSECFY